jgi:hypothetical protein
MAGGKYYSKGDGYGGGYGDLYGARAAGYCLYPQQIRSKLAHYGWRGFDVVSLGSQYAYVCSYRHGKPYELKVDRCSGEVYKAKPLYGYGYGAGYGY